MTRFAEALAASDEGVEITFVDPKTHELVTELVQKPAARKPRKGEVYVKEVASND